MTDTAPAIIPESPSKHSGLNNNDNEVLTQASDRNNNDDSPSQHVMEMLAKMEEANRLIESDSKSLNSLSGQSGQSGHSRRSSDTSQVSVTSGQSGGDPEEDLWTLWGHIVNDWDTWSKKKPQHLKDLVRRGIPQHFRGLAWQLLCGAHNSPHKHKYAEYIKSSSPCEKVIRRDIARTYPEHDFFKEKDGLGQESLFNVMKAYSLHDREVGYCQGSAFIVGLLLMQQMPEEEAFAVFVHLMQDYRMREMFKPSMSELGLCMFQLESLVQELLPELHVHFSAQSFNTSMYASSWFLTLFTTALPLSLAFRVMDLFLSEGIEMIFRLAIAILQMSRDCLLQMDMEGMLKYFQKEMPAVLEADPENLVHTSFNVKYNAKRMKKLEKEYTVMKSREQEETLELRRLRTENKLLRQRIESLEAESAALADRLIQGQVCRAEEQECNFAIQRELAAIKQHDCETNRKLEEARERIRKLSQMMEESSRESSIAEVSLKSELIRQKEELIACLQEELVNVRLREAESEATIRDLRARVQELEEDKKKLRESTVDNSVAHLQEELIAVKLREAEATLALKELRQKLSELNQMWNKHLQDAHSDNTSQESGGSAKKLLFWENNKSEGRLEEELFSSKLRETEASAEVTELRHKVMELEAQTQVYGNQVKRAEEEAERLKSQVDDVTGREKRKDQQLRDQHRKYVDLESKMKEELMLARIRDAENSQCVAELTQKISSLEVKNQEVMVELDLNKEEDTDKVRGLQDRVADLKAEVMRLQLGSRPRKVAVGSGDSAAQISPDHPPSPIEDLTIKLPQGIETS